MRFRNSLRIFMENFKSVSKMLLYQIVVWVVFIALTSALLLPRLTEIVESTQMENVLDYVKEFLKAVASGNSAYLGGFQAEFKVAVKALLSLLKAKTATLVWSFVGVAVIYLLKRFADTVCFYAVGSMLDDKLSNYAETPFSTAIIKNLGRASLYSLVYVPVVFLVDVFTLAACYFVFFYLLGFLNVFISLFLSMTLIVACQSLKLTFTSSWLPAMTADNATLRQALRLADKEERKRRRKMFTTYVVSVYIIIIINVMGALSTFGSALLITVPASYFFFICEQYVNYYAVKGKPYFLSYRNVYENRERGNSEDFFECLEQKELQEQEEAIALEKEKKEANMDYRENYEKWISDPRLSEEGKAELTAIAENEKEKEYRFGGELEFGTAGMRGVIGFGMNMMNVYTVMRATQGLAAWVSTLGEEAKAQGVVISYDTRRKSAEFARAAAEVLAKNGIKAYLFDDVRPVPMLSYAVRYLQTVAGVMITASHNPKEYNGYKVYGSDGAQMSPEDTAKVVSYIEKIDDYLSVTGEANELIQPVPQKLDEDYIEELTKLKLSSEAVKACGEDLKLVYTPVHGSGYVPVTTVLSKLGINVTVVEEQTKKDTEFSTVKVPNPEFKETLSMGIKLANEINADVVFGTDPDSDRLGVAVKDENGEFVALSGNQVGILLLDYILTRLEAENALPNNAAVVKSFVTTGMARAICEDHGVTLFETPVGFKFIGEKIKQWEVDGNYTYVFGFEESCGYLRGTHARDKDAVVASMLCAEMVCYYKYVGKTVYARLQEIYAKYGYVLDQNVSTQYSGLNAMKEMNAVVDGLKERRIDALGGKRVVAFRDYSAAKRAVYVGENAGAVEEMDIPKCNCVYYELEGGSFVCVRPSGTEPKLKVYYSIREKDEASAKAVLGLLQVDVETLLK